MACVREILWSDIFATDILALGNLQSHIVHNTQPFTLQYIRTYRDKEFIYIGDFLIPSFFTQKDPYER